MEIKIDNIYKVKAERYAYLSELPFSEVVLNSEGFWEFKEGCVQESFKPGTTRIRVLNEGMFKMFSIQNGWVCHVYTTLYPEIKKHCFIVIFDETFWEEDILSDVDQHKGEIYNPMTKTWSFF